VRDFYFWRGRTHSPSSISPPRWRTLTVSLSLFFFSHQRYFYIYSWDAMCVDYVSTVRFTRIFRILSSKRNLSNQPDVPDGCVARTRRDSPARYTALLALFFSPLAVSLHRAWSWITNNFTRKALRYNTTSRLFLYLDRGCNTDMVQKAKLSIINHRCNACSLTIHLCRSRLLSA